jgi:hypothetical protein
VTHANDDGPVLPAALHPDFGDWPQMLNMRDWLEAACQAKGAKFTGGGCGMGEADIDIELEGHHFNIRIRPLIRATPREAGAR